MDGYGSQLMNSYSHYSIFATCEPVMVIEFDCVDTIKPKNFPNNIIGNLYAHLELPPITDFQYAILQIFMLLEIPKLFNKLI